MSAQAQTTEASKRIVALPAFHCPTMALETSFESYFQTAFAGLEKEAEEFKSWLIKEKVFTAEEYGLMAANEEACQAEIIDPATTAGAFGGEICMKIRIKMLWKLCRCEDAKENKASDVAESQDGLPDKVRKSMDQLYLKQHGMALSPGRRLVSTQLRPMHDMSHAVAPAIRDFPLLPVRKMRLQDNSIQVVSTDAELKEAFAVYVRVRAFNFSMAFTNMDNQAFWDLEAAEMINDKLMLILFSSGPQGRPPVTHFTNAWDEMSRVFQLAVRGGRMLKEVAAADASWKHIWTSWNPSPRSIGNQDGDFAARSGRKRGGGGGAEGTGSRSGYAASGAGQGSPRAPPTDAVRRVQAQKDKEIADLKRKLRTSEKEKAHTGYEDSRGGGKWPRRK